ncbi:MULTISPECIES: hypothetical protein [Alteromonas]|uniref:Uncharacterized protein n=1 Tax=Alteromonas stellipolaris TaxID=233316 RepID=A0AAW7Z492_9ALTE|nr:MULTISPECIES: hypothetical protein [Alteromonas]AMJ91464.1 hypothetical protein AV940_13835 [Alteromonas sp. Mac2]ALM89723.1 hypothetical protein AOR13_671 [Alteromonas stellipolaris LMG 21856]AMJ87601.1 hypothetical protein AV939_14095 [Alteromonas sp. Mac1]MDO6537591.1 hypothetical protein [Alteromonas stellipolaris]MDO6577890.1 hypothetical protein [Alteromonas stellipolaris]
MNSAILIGALVCLLANLVFYAGCPNQQWFKKSLLSFNTALLIALALLVLSTAIFSLTFSLPAAIYTIITLCMLLLGTLPFFTRYTAPLKSVRSRGTGLTRDESYTTFKAHWWLKTIGATLISFPFALFTSSLISLLFLSNTPLDVKSQFLMWLIVPFWLTPISLIFFAKKPWLPLALLSLITLFEFSVLQVLG